MLTMRKSADRGHFDHGWLDTRHTFSFAGYHDPDHMGFRSLRVINEDRVQPGKGFGRHFHRDMEILTYVIEGSLKHADSMGNESAIAAGEFQRMTAGTGVEHSEWNDSSAQVVHLLQIWIFPDRRGLEPEYEQKKFPESEMRQDFRPVATPDGVQSSLIIHQDAHVFVARLEAGESRAHALATGRAAWIQVVRGRAMVNGVQLGEGDGAAVSAAAEVRVQAVEPGEVLLFDLA